MEGSAIVGCGGVAVLGCGLELELDHPTGRIRLCQPSPAAPRPTKC